MTFRDRKVLALIPARGGSKGVRRKNLRIIRNKPLLAYTVEAALRSDVVDAVYVSSDNNDILQLASQLGVIAVRRPDAAATDVATATEVVASFVSYLPSILVLENPYIVYLQPTSPLRSATHIDAAFEEMKVRNGVAVISVVSMRKTPFKAFILGNDGLLQPLFDEQTTNANRQELPPVYYPNGAIYAFTINEFLGRGRFPSSGSVPFIMSERDSLDIDSEDDITLMEDSDA